MINWTSVFDEAYPQPGASPAEIAALVEQVKQPLSTAEITEINSSQQNPFPKNDALYNIYRPFDPRSWQIPRRSLPPTYLNFLRWSNSGEFGNGKRWIQFEHASRLRRLLIGYQVPEYMPAAVPFGLDGSGVLYLFDMRQPPTHGEYPILVAAAGNLNYDDAVVIAHSFLELCRGTTSAYAVLYSL
jgi:hypothetical protein